MKVYGPVIDHETRCTHYNTKKDIIAIKFKCCNRYYPCFQCHNECESHSIKRWTKDEFYKKAILCGHCQTELSIREYMETTNCPYCGHIFNEGCATHYPIYFDV